MKKSFKFLMMICLASGLGAGLNTGCRPRQDALAQPPQMPPPTVTVVPVELREVIEWREFTGRTAPVEYVEVRPRVSGHIQSVRFHSGQMVQKGDVLFEIDPRWHQAALDQAEAALSMAEVRLKNAEREAARSAQLLEARAISREEADARESRLAESRAAVMASKALRDAAKLDLDHTQVLSPIAGRVSREMVTAGNYVSGMAGNATLLTTVVSVDPVFVYLDIDEASHLALQSVHGDKLGNGKSGAGVSVELQLADEADFQHKGVVESMDNKLDPQTGSMVMRASFPNPDGRIIPGLFARLRVPMSGLRGTLLVDERAIGTDQAQKFVLTLTSSNTVAYRPVQLGPVIDGMRVLKSGLDAGDKVIQNIVMARVRPGMQVQVQTGNGSAPATGAEAGPGQASSE